VAAELGLDVDQEALFLLLVFEALLRLLEAKVGDRAVGLLHSRVLLDGERKEAVVLVFRLRGRFFLVFENNIDSIDGVLRVARFFYL
jgi:hypothetical protein